MRPSFVLLLTLLLLASTPAPPAGGAAHTAPPPVPRLFASLVRLDAPSAIVYPARPITLAVQVATDSATELPVFVVVYEAPQLRQWPGEPRSCRNDVYRYFCAFVVDAAHPIVFTLDAVVRETPPGVITSTLEVWPIEIGRSALITATLPLTVVAPARAYLPLVAR